MRQFLFNNIKNLSGWRTNRKIVVISVDDYGNVRLASKKARENLDRAGLKVHARFDAFDTLETREDLEQLYEVLNSARDKHGKPSVFTPFALPCNIDFEAMEEEDYRDYRYELLPETYRKLSTGDPQAYQGAWALWQEGISKGLMAPQFHGREHFNLKVFNEKLAQRDHEVLAALKNRSYTSISGSGYPTIGWTAAFSFSGQEDIETFPEILRTGTDAFEQVFGYRSESFTPPAQQFPLQLESTLRQYGIRHLDKPFVRQRHLGDGNYRREFNSTRHDRRLGLNILVRNVVFEPTDGQGDHVGKALRQVEAAFRLRKPANISSHRVNFCGHINERNRAKGLGDLKNLLQQIVRRWPDVEFMAAHELGNLIGGVSEPEMKAKSIPA